MLDIFLDIDKKSREIKIKEKRKQELKEVQEHKLKFPKKVVIRRDSKDFDTILEKLKTLGEPFYFRNQFGQNENEEYYVVPVDGRLVDQGIKKVTWSKKSMISEYSNMAEKVKEKQLKFIGWREVAQEETLLFKMESEVEILNHEDVFLGLNYIYLAIPTGFNEDGWQFRFEPIFKSYNTRDLAVEVDRFRIPYFREPTDDFFYFENLEGNANKNYFFTWNLYNWEVISGNSRLSSTISRKYLLNNVNKLSTKEELLETFNDLSNGFRLLDIDKCSLDYFQKGISDKISYKKEMAERDYQKELTEFDKKSDNEPNKGVTKNQLKL